MFKHGVRIQNVNPDSSKSNSGEYGTVIGTSGGVVTIEYDNGNIGSSNKPEKFYKIVGGTNVTKPMNSIVKFARGLVLSADEKLLREQGLKTDCGVYTCEAQEIILAKIFADNEAYLIDIAKAKKAEDKENK